MSQSGKTLRDVIIVLTTTVLFAVILCLVVFSARGYQHSAEIQDASANTRAVLSYVVNSVRDSGSSDVKIEDISGTQCLVISNEDYDQRFYLYDGKLMEEYTEPDAGNNPDVALEIGKTDQLEFVIDDEGILTIRTDSGSSAVNTGRRR
jgi:hypothetical protein